MSDNGNENGTGQKQIAAWLVLLMVRRSALAGELRAIEDILLKYNQIQRRLCPNGKRKAP